MSDVNPLIVAAPPPPASEPPPPSPPPLPLPSLAFGDRNQVWGLVGAALAIGVVFPIGSVFAVLIVPIFGVACLYLGPFVGFVLGAFAVLRGEQVGARWVGALGMVVGMVALLGAVLVWGGTVAFVWQVLQRVG